MRNLLIAAVFVATAVAAGTTGGRAQAPTFDVASIKLNTNSEPSSMRVLPNGIDYVRQPARNLIAQAYDVVWGSISTSDVRLEERLVRGNYNLSARTPRPASPSELMEMLQALLVERFKLAIHRESRLEQIYRLSVAAGGSKLTESTGEGVTVFAPIPSGGVECRNMPMADFVRYLSGRMGRVVINATELRGRYDFTLRVNIPGFSDARDEALASSRSPDAIKAAVIAANDWSSSSIFADIQTQIGLKLEADRGAINRIVVDRLEPPDTD